MTAIANRPMMRAEPQPHALAWTSARTSAVNPTVNAAMPGMSTSRVAVSSRDSCVANSVTTTAMAATGRLMKKIARQLTYSVSQPPSSGPSARAIADTPAHVPIARPRSAGGNVLVMIDSVPGIISAAPRPWTARDATSQPSEGAKPIVALAAAKTTTPIRKTLRRPKMSPSRPPVTRKTAKASEYALIVHSSDDSEASKLRWIDGSATLTTVLSSITMNSAKHMAASVHQRRFSSESRSRSVTGLDPFDDGEQRSEEVVPLVGRDLGHERVEGRQARAREPIDDLAAVVRQRDEARAAILGGFAACDETTLDEPVDRPGGGGEGQAEVGGDLLDGVLAAVLEQEQHLHLRERGTQLVDDPEQL